MAIRFIIGDARERLKTLPDESVHCVVTSPPYFGLRDYGVSGQMGLESTPEVFIDGMVAVFAEVRRVLRADGTLWLNMGDTYAKRGGPGWQGKNGQRSDRRFTGARNTVPMREQARTAYAGYKPKDLLGMPWMLAFALRADGWWLRQDVIWHKPNPMPESVRDRCTKAHEYLFLLSKSERYYFDNEAISEPAAYPEGPGNMRQKYADAYEAGDERHRTAAGLANIGASDRRNKRSVWTIASEPYPDAHFATFPSELPRLCILAGSRPGDTVLDPFAGSGTTLQVAIELGRQA